MSDTGSGWVRRSLDRLRGRPVLWRAAEHYATRFDEIATLEEDLRSLSDESLRVRGRALDAGSPMAEIFAVVREVANRCVGMRPFDVQILAGLVMHGGDLAEMATGEGKTLAAVAPTVAHALTGRGAHVLTFNDYLARRDAAWMKPIYEFLGLSVGVIQESMTAAERSEAYDADVTYATAKEVGFDFLRGQLTVTGPDRVQRPFHYAIVDEADSILIDEARVPLVIAGQLSGQADAPSRFAELASALAQDVHFALDENGRNVNLTNAGIDHVERTLMIDDLLSVEQVDTMTRLNAALHARILLHRDVDYLVREGRIELIDEFTGRVVEDRHLPDGLQAAVEAKEGLGGTSKGTILGTCTLQHLLRRYGTLAGMTATAYTACEEFREFYDMTTVVVPSNRPSVRIDHPDRLFATAELKRAALVEEVTRVHRTGRPILVGTASVAESEQLAGRLRDAGVDCRVLNARRDDEEAEIIADAGKRGAVTISTNMAGRGTDIRLGGADGQGHDDVAALGGLYVIGTNRHESRRIDNQLRGRAGRQGDPGSTRFFIGLEDPLLERFDLFGRIPAPLRSTMQGSGTQAEIDHPVILAEVERTQRIVEGQNLDIRRTLTRYSDMIEQQRQQLHARREEALDGHGPSFLREKTDRFDTLAIRYGDHVLAGVERDLTLALIDRAWRDHLAFVTELRDAIHLRTVARLDPLAEFQREVIEVFAGCLRRLDEEIIETFERASIDADGIDLDGLGLQAPSSTWTYIVSDDPFRDQLYAKIGGTVAGLGLVVNFPLVALWAIYARWLRKKRVGRSQAPR